MQEHPVTYVSRITNLSDARYCAGMGVDLLGFVVDPADPDYVSPDSFQQMIGWVSGPARVMEVGTFKVDLATLREQYAPDYLHIPHHRLDEFTNSTTPLIVELPFEQWDAANLNTQGVAWWMVTGTPDVPASFTRTAPILVARHDFPGSVAGYLEACGATGVALSGTREVAPGLKDYDHLSQVLEELNG